MFTSTVACPVGTMYDKKSFKCEPCLKGSFQDQEGQESCVKCYDGKTTKSSGAVSSEDCFPGEFISQPYYCRRNIEKKKRFVEGSLALLFPRVPKWQNNSKQIPGVILQNNRNQT